MNRAAGFTLLETLVALAILGVVMATVFGVIGSGLRSAHRDEDRLLLGLVAENLLVRSHLDLNPIEGTRSGDIGGGLRWRIESEPYVLPKDILPERPTASDDSMTSFAKAGKGGAEAAATASTDFAARDTGTDTAARPAFDSTTAGWIALPRRPREWIALPRRRRQSRRAPWVAATSGKRRSRESRSACGWSRSPSRRGISASS